MQTFRDRVKGDPESDIAGPNDDNIISFHDPSSSAQ
jgi:hypothetical protein